MNARKEITTALESARAAYEANGKKPFDAGFYEGLKLAVELMDKEEAESWAWNSQFLKQAAGEAEPK